MPKILFVKTTSLGDLIHSMPALTDLQRAQPGVELHWLVEEGFAAVPTWHPFVRKVHACAIRRWRQSLFSGDTRREIRVLKNRLLAENYDLVIDAQGLVKSALMVRWFRCDRHGFDRCSIKEKVASLAYSHRHAISRELGAIERVRRLLSQSLAYPLEGLALQFGMKVTRPEQLAAATTTPYVIFLHGTNWESKIWPARYWQTLAGALVEQGLQVYLPWGNEAERERASQIAARSGATVLARESLGALAYLLQNARFVVGSDTGLTHLAAALATRTIGIYGSTSPKLTGLVGEQVVSLQSDKSCSPCFRRECPLVAAGEEIPCYGSVGPDRVLGTIREMDHV